MNETINWPQIPVCVCDIQFANDDGCYWGITHTTDQSEVFTELCNRFNLF